MTQLSLEFDEEQLEENGNDILPADLDEQEDDSNDGEFELQSFTSEQLEILSFLREIIGEGFDPGCPLKIYVTQKKFYKVDYLDKKQMPKTGYIALAKNSKIEKTLEGAKFKELKINSVEEVSEEQLPQDYKLLNTDIGNLFSFKLDHSLSTPKWFSISYNKRVTKVQVILNRKEIDNNPEIKKALDGYDYSYVEQWCNIKTGVTHEELMQLLHQIRPILKDRYVFIYSHRLVDPCCCELQEKCMAEQCCVSENREMQMKCSFRKLKEREGEFIKPAKYSIYNG